MGLTKKARNLFRALARLIRGRARSTAGFNASQKQSYEEQWDTISRLCRSSHRQWMSPSGSIIMETPPDELYNLPVVLAFSLLDEVLGDLAGQGIFTPPPNAMLERKMKASRHVLPWVDYAAVNNARKRRNALAHKGTLIPKSDCLRFVGLIGTELKAFGAIS